MLPANITSVLSSSFQERLRFAETVDKALPSSSEATILKARRMEQQRMDQARPTAGSFRFRVDLASKMVTISGVSAFSYWASSDTCRVWVHHLFTERVNVDMFLVGMDSSEKIRVCS